MTGYENMSQDDIDRLLGLKNGIVPGQEDQVSRKVGREVIEVGRKVGKVGREVGKSGHKSKYPWAEWLDGKFHEVDPVQYDLTKPKLQARLHNRATNEGMVVATCTFNGVLGFQFFPDMETRNRAWDDDMNDGYGDEDKDI